MTKKKKIETAHDSRIISADSVEELEKEIHTELYKIWRDGKKKDEQIVISIKDNTAVITRSFSPNFSFSFDFEESRIESVLNILRND